MPRGDKGAYTDKQKRKAEHIEDSYEERGVSTKEAEARAWATVNKESGGGKKSGSGRGKKENHSASKKGRKTAAKKKAAKKSTKKSGKKSGRKAASK
jgi:plasmid stabilization system protein ParE